MNRRKYDRKEVFLLSRFQWLNSHNDLISGKAQIINLSEDNMFIYKMVAINVTTGRAMSPEKLIERKYIPIRFCLNNKELPIVITGEIVRIARYDETLSAGVRFSEITQDDQDRIIKYIDKKTIRTRMNEILDFKFLDLNSATGH